MRLWLKKQRESKRQLIGKGIQSQDTMVRQKSDEPLRTDETVAKQVGLGSRNTYRQLELG